MANTQRHFANQNDSDSKSNACQSSCRVVKIGGSLLDLPDLSARITAWLSTQSAMPTVWIVGGGTEVEALREYDRNVGADQEAIHWAAIDVMSTNSKSIHQSLFSRCKLLAEIDELEEALHHSDSTNILFDCSNWLRGNFSLPRTWEVTSDSIALALAREVTASEIVLLKSVGVGKEKTIVDWVQSGVVDKYFEILFQEVFRETQERGVNLTASCVNLRKC